MFLRRLDALAAQFAAMKSKPAEKGWNHEALAAFNRQIDDLLTAALGRLDHLKDELKLRMELQQLLRNAGLDGKPSVQMLWNDQMNFYAAWISKAQAYFSEENDTYVSFSLTVVELLFLVRLMLEEGVFQTETLQPVFLFISKYSVNQQQKPLSFSSLQKKYSTHNSAAHDRVRKLLLQMILRIDRYDGAP